MPTTLWPSHTGTITRIKEGRGANGPFVTFTVEIPKKDGTAFKRDAIAFRGVMDTVLALGVGARVYMRGPLRHARKTNAQGRAYTITSMTAHSVLHKPLPAPGQPHAHPACAQPAEQGA